MRTFETMQDGYVVEREVDGGWGNLVMGNEEDIWCDKHPVLCITNESLTIISKTKNVKKKKEILQELPKNYQNVTKRHKMSKLLLENGACLIQSYHEPWICKICHICEA